MSHKYSESIQTSHPKGVKQAFKEPTIIKYTGGVTTTSGDKGGVIFNRPNEIRTFQSLFQVKNSLPVHLKRGKSDELIYKGLMMSSVVGLIIASFGIYRMAMPKKPAT
eukprot:Seg2875.5 transcript_id=Seg2875.5/GoldUCD/mRNA.D3Y31 product="Cytochrome c oxidase subunit 7A2 mitochondrial" protein_id=Seg2875.5/GoldUCD/D3Y31